MNCKQGDLAVLVKSTAGNEGKIVRCVRYVGRVNWNDGRGGSESLETWETDQLIRDASGVVEDSWYVDRDMRPIRSSDEPDETLSWCDVPSKVTA